MKKITNTILALLIVVSSFAQLKYNSANQKAESFNIPFSSQIEEGRNISGLLSEDFEGVMGLPLGWETSVQNPWVSTPASGYTHCTNHTDGGNGNIVVFNAYNMAHGDIGYLATPKLSITNDNHSLSFWVNYFKVGNIPMHFAKLEVLVSTNGGQNWSVKTPNIVEGKAEQGWFQFTLDLNDYVGSNILVALRGTSDAGYYNIAIDDFQGPDVWVPETPDLIVKGALNTSYSKIPLTQISEITPSATVGNLGNELTEATNLKITIANTDYEEILPISVPMDALEQETLNASSAFTPEATGVYDVIYTAELENDFNPSNNTNTLNLEVTEDILAYDNENFEENGIGSDLGASLGNKFTFTADGSLKGAKFYAKGPFKSYDCVVKVFDFTNGTQGDLLAQSASITVLTNQSKWYEVDFADIPVSEGQTVMIVVDNRASEANMALAIDKKYVPNTSYMYSYNSNQWKEIGTSFGFSKTLAIRAIVGEEVFCLAPTDLSAENITATSLDASWVNEFGAESFNIKWGELNAPESQTTMVNDVTSPYSISGLKSSRQYAFYVQSSCGDGELSDWAGPYLFTTSCEAISDYPYTEGFEFFPNDCWKNEDVDGDDETWQTITYFTHSGSKAIMSGSRHHEINNQYPLFPNNYLITPKFEITSNTLLLTYYVRTISETKPAEHYSVLISKTGNNPDDFTEEVYSETLTVADTAFKKVQLFLTNYEGEEIYIAFRHHDVTDQFQMIIDDFSITDVSDAKILDYTIPNQLSSSIDMENKKVTVEMPHGTDVSNLVANFVLSQGATAKIDATEQESGVTANDFTNSLTYTVTAQNGNQEDWTVSVIVASSVEDNLFENLTIAPNPTTGVVNIKGTDAYGVEILDITGRVLNRFEMTENTKVVDMSSYQAGLYIVRVSKNNHSANYKIIKQ